MLNWSLAFPLLREIERSEDPKAKNVFKNETVAGFTCGRPSVMRFLLTNKYLEDLNLGELIKATNLDNFILKNNEFDFLREFKRLVQKEGI